MKAVKTDGAHLKGTRPGNASTLSFQIETEKLHGLQLACMILERSVDEVLSEAIEHACDGAIALAIHLSERGEA